jgi:hypothetical protein
MIGGGSKRPWWFSLRLHRRDACATVYYLIDGNLESRLWVTASDSFQLEVYPWD